MNIKKFIPHFSAVAIFLVVTLVYFNPLLKGKRLFQSDITHFEGMAKEIKDFRKNTGEEALWTNSMFGGMPAFQISVLYKGNLIQYVDTIFTLGLPHPANVVFLCFIGFFLLLLVMKVDPLLSIAGALAYGFSSFFFIILDVGHNTQAHAIAYMAPVVAGVILTYRGKLLAGGLLTALFLALELYANHLQITYYLGLTLILFGLATIFDAVKNKTLPAFIKSSAVVGIATLLALSTNTANLWSTYEYGKYTTRGESDLTINPDGTSNASKKTTGLDKDYATAWSYGIGETFTLLIPGFYGNSSTFELSKSSEVYKELSAKGYPNVNNIVKQMPVYWGDQGFTSGPVYVGAIVFFLFVLGFFLIQGPLKWWLLAATVLSIILSWGKNFMSFNELMLDYFPGYNKFRAVSMTLVIAEFTMPLLAFLTLAKIFGRNEQGAAISSDEIIKKLKYSLYIVGGVLLFFILFCGSLFDFTGPSDAQFDKLDWLLNALKDDREWMLRKDAMRSLIFILLLSGIIWADLKNKIKRNFSIAAIIVLILADMWSVDKNYLNNDSFASKNKVDVPYSPSQADQQILADNDPNFRVYNTTARLDQDSRTSYFHKSLGGYHGAKLKRYQELIDFHVGRGNIAVINMLNAKYVISDNDKGEVFAQRNPGALGNAWFVDEYKLVENADSEITAMRFSPEQTGFNPATTAIVDKRFEEHLKGFSPSTDTTGVSDISLTSYKPNHLTYLSKANSEQLAVFSEIFYDNGWKVFVDGNPSSYFRANYILRAMRIPAGEHTIEFKFEPDSYFIGEKISLAGSAFLIGLVITGIILGFMKKETTVPTS